MANIFIYFHYSLQGFRDYAFFFSANYALFFGELCVQNPGIMRELCELCNILKRKVLMF